MQISVIMTTYNRPDALARVFSGLHQQTLPPYEVLIADDGSAPETAALVKKLADTVPFPVRHVWHADKGFRAAAIRNKAIRRSTGDYLVLLDGDCIPDRHFIADHCRLARQGFFFQGKRVLVQKQRTPTFRFADIATPGRKMRLLFKSGIGNRHHLLRLAFFPATSSQSLSGVRSCNLGLFRDDLVAVNGFNEEFVGWGREDSELVVRLLNYGLKRRSHPFMAVCYHLWHPENDRNRLPLNDELLKQMIESGERVCSKGLVQAADPGA
jgi:glycosyltransferase involved in cell wall biosynthesis